MLMLFAINTSNYKMKEKKGWGYNDTTRKTQRKEKKKGVRLCGILFSVFVLI